MTIEQMAKEIGSMATVFEVLDFRHLPKMSIEKDLELFELWKQINGIGDIAYERKGESKE